MLERQIRVLSIQGKDGPGAPKRRRRVAHRGIIRLNGVFEEGCEWAPGSKWAEDSSGRSCKSLDALRCSPRIQRLDPGFGDDSG
jgi:hypothetical protein